MAGQGISPPVRKWSRVEWSEEAYRRAQEKVAAGDLEGAEMLLRQAVDCAEEPAPYLAGLASFLGLQGRTEEALDLLNQALERYPEEPRLLVAYGMTLRAVGEAAGAEECFRMALSQDPDQPAALHHLSLLLWDQGRQEEAEEAARLACQLSPDQREFSFSFAGMLAALGREAEAAETLATAFVYRPDDVELLEAAVGHALAAGLPERAREILLSTRFPNPAVMARRADLLDALGCTAEAEEVLEEAGADFPGHPELVLVRARMLDRAGDRSMARQLVEGLAGSEGASPRLRSQALMSLAQMQLEGGEHEAAAESLATARQLAPGASSATALASVCYLLGRYEEAVALCQEALADEVLPHSLMTLALALAALNREAEALEAGGALPADLVPLALEQLQFGSGAPAEEKLRSLWESQLP
jgi:tetratricopeptide (TPR) repeat protein